MRRENAIKSLPSTIDIESLTLLGSCVLVVDQFDVAQWASKCLVRLVGRNFIGEKLCDLTTPSDRPVVSLAMKTAGALACPLRGAWIPLGSDNYRIFVGSPVPNSTEEMSRLGLQINDFVESDSWLSYLILSDEAAATEHVTAARIERLKLEQSKLADANRHLEEARHATLNMMFDLEEARHAAEEATHAKSQFLASMSHELRTPLNGIIGMSDLLAGTNLAAKQRQFVDACRSSGETLLSLINDILDFSKIEAGKVELDVHEFELETLAIDTVDAMVWRAKQKGLEMPCRVARRACQVFKGDSGRLRQVLTNLLSNAVKFTESGEITLSVSVVDEATNQTHVRFEVRDTGIGIPNDRRDRLFGAFSQIDSSVTRKYGGTGLGLSISQSLVELMGGTIGVASEPGVGSTFWIQIPLERGTENVNECSMRSPMECRRILIVDDNETNRTVLAEYTSECGHSNTAVASVDEALRAIEQADADRQPFDLILTDYLMPNRDGLELSTALKERSDIPVILVVAMDLDIESSELDQFGVKCVLHKPLRRREICEMIHTVLADTPQSKGEFHDQFSSNTNTPLSNHLLLVEDNAINRMYMVEVIQQLGCTCDTASNGQEAVDAVQRNQYDLVLMDCQMPIMDGLEATRQIRHLESQQERSDSLPIVALTANAIKGDRERCLDAGMDDYITKPVKIEKVRSVLEQHQRVASVETASVSEPSDAMTDDVLPPTTAPAFDANAMLERCFGNVDFANSLLDELESTGLQRVEEIRKPGLQNNAGEMANAAHALKGAAGILCAEALQSTAAKIEQAGRSSDMVNVASMLDELTEEMRRCLDCLPRLRQELESTKHGNK